MTNIQKKFVTALATGAVLLSTVTSSAFATTITISGNGSGSDSNANVNFDNNVDVNQSNDAYINNNVDVDADTGDNDANDNTGGDVNVTTGDADVDVKIDNKANTNVANVTPCGGCQVGADVKISGNGSDSNNTVDLNMDNNVVLNQDNYANFDNNVDVDADTGDNYADDNTGGNVNVTTGDATVGVKIANAANYNSAKIGGGNGNGGGVVSALISGNGSNSYNDIDLNFDNNVDVNQDNDAYINNNVDFDAETGDNGANDNTGGDVVLGTGDATANIEIDNMANFNSADVDACGCLENLEAKIAGNGSDSLSEIGFDSENNLDLDQENDSDFDNAVDGDSDTGDNYADDNTGIVDEGSDPSLTTGDADADVKLNNSGNVNVYGADAEDWENLFDGLHLNLTFDLGDLLDWFSSQAN